MPRADPGQLTCPRAEERCIPFDGNGQPGGTLGDQDGFDACMPVCSDADATCEAIFGWAYPNGGNAYPTVVPGVNETVEFYLPF